MGVTQRLWSLWRARLRRSRDQGDPCWPLFSLQWVVTVSRSFEEEHRDLFSNWYRAFSFRMTNMGQCFIALNISFCSQAATQGPGFLCQPFQLWQDTWANHLKRDWLGLTVLEISIHSYWVPLFQAYSNILLVDVCDSLKLGITALGHYGHLWSLSHRVRVPHVSQEHVSNNHFLQVDPT